MSKEYYDEETGKWVTSTEDAPEGVLEESYDFLKRNIPPMLQSGSDKAVNAFDATIEGVHDFFVGPDEIPTLSNDMGSYEPPYKPGHAMGNAGGSLAAGMPGYEAMAIGAAREADNLVYGARNLGEKLGLPQLPVKQNRVLGFNVGTDQKREREINKPILDAVRDEHPISHAVGATSIYMTPGLNAPLKALESAPVKSALDVPLKNASRLLYDAGAKKTALNLRALPKTLAESPAANTIATGAGVGALHPEMTAEEGAFYGAAGYGIGKLGYGKLSQPRNYNTPDKNKLLKWGKSKGYDIDPGVKTGDIKMQQMDQGFLKNSSTAHPFHIAKLKNRDINNRIVTKLVGQETQNVNEEWFASTGKHLKAARNEIYNNLEATTTNPNIAKKINGVLTKYTSQVGEQNIPKIGQLNPNHDPIVDLYVNKVWKLLDNKNGKVPMGAWKAVRGQLDKQMDTFAKQGDPKNLVEYFDELADAMDDMLSGSKNKEFLGRLQRNKLKSAVRYHAMKTQQQSGEIDMNRLYNTIQRKYPSQIRGIEKTGNQNLDEFYNALKLNKAMQHTPYKASLAVSDRISKLFANPATRTSGKLGYLFSKNSENMNFLNSALVNTYRKIPQIGLPSGTVRNNLGMGPITRDEMAGALAGRYAISER